MSYIGKQPRKAALTASDIEDGIITAAKIEDGAVVAAEIASNAVTTAKINADAVTSAKIADNAVVTAAINADAVTGAKIADDAINSEHYVADSIDAEHYAAGSVDTTALGADAVTGAKIADDAINSEHYTDGSIDTAHIADGQVTTAKLASAVFTGATDIGADLADADLILVDDGAGGTIRKAALSRIKTYNSAEKNQPYFRAYMGGTNTLTDNTTTRVVYDSVSWNVGGTYATGTHRWTPGTAGRYFINAKVQIDFADTSANRLDLILRKNGSNVNYHRVKAGGDHQGASSVHMTCTVDLDGDDYVEIFAEQDSNAGKTYDGTSQYNWWEGFLISKT